MVDNHSSSSQYGYFRNSDIGYYAWQSLVKGGMDYMGETGIYPAQSGNPDLSWEKTWTTNLALHLGFWNRINLDVELYNKKTTDMLMDVPQSYAVNGSGKPLGQYRSNGQPGCGSHGER